MKRKHLLKESLDEKAKDKIRQIKRKIMDLTETTSELSIKLNDIHNDLFDILVPAAGNANTEAGELVRAVNRICYRWWNDGDMIGEGYGRETVNPAVRYIIHIFQKYGDLHQMIDYENMLNGYLVGEDVYEKYLDHLMYISYKLIVLNDLTSVSNSEDMWDYRNKEEDVDHYEDEEDEWDDFEDETDQYFDDDDE